MKKMTRRQQLIDFFSEYSLFMPPSPDAREAVYLFVHKGNKYKLGGTTPTERATRLREVTEELRGQCMVHKNQVGKRVPLRVLYVLPKTEREIERWLFERKSAQNAQMEVPKLSPYKVCVTSSSRSQPSVTALDMLVLTSV
jgi:hypothetical protein